VHPKLE